MRGGASFEVDDDRSWYIVRLAPRMGDRAIQALVAQKIEVFIPRTTRIATYRGRRVVRSAQLLLRTAFIGLSGQSTLETVRQSVGVAEIVSRPAFDETARGNVAGEINRPIRLDPETLQRFVDSVTKDEIVQPFGVAVGQAVVVRDGPFSSFPGVVEDILPDDRFKIAVAIFGRSTPIELGIAQFEAMT